MPYGPPMPYGGGPYGGPGPPAGPSASGEHAGGAGQGEPPSKRMRWEPRGAASAQQLPYWGEGGAAGAAGPGFAPGAAPGMLAPPHASMSAAAWPGAGAGGAPGAADADVRLGSGFPLPPGANAPPWGIRAPQLSMLDTRGGSDASAATGGGSSGPAAGPTQLSIAGRGGTDASASGSGSLTSRCGSGPLLGIRPPTPWAGPEGGSLMGAASLGGRSGSGRSGSLGGRSATGAGSMLRAASLGASGGRSGSLAGRYALLVHECLSNNTGFRV